MAPLTRLRRLVLEVESAEVPSICWDTLSAKANLKELGLVLGQGQESAVSLAEQSGLKKLSLHAPDPIARAIWQSLPESTQLTSIEIDELSPITPVLTRLDLSQLTHLSCTATDETLQRFLPLAPNLQSLVVSEPIVDKLHGKFLDPVLDAGGLQQLRSLSFAWCGNIQDEALLALPKHGINRQLRHLDLEDSGVFTPQGFRALFQHEYPCLSMLLLDGTSHEIEFVLDEMSDRFGSRMKF